MVKDFANSTACRFSCGKARLSMLKSEPNFYFSFDMFKEHNNVFTSNY
ncbi:hypothetical protein HMPREF1128_0950 [Haemophilus sputorum HK 2154]|nr:hypothetical protein HMPREF1128_0950 [Haemophilus sputorum HK 2154]